MDTPVVRWARFLQCSSFIEATLHRKERMATDLLAFHSFIHTLLEPRTVKSLLSAGPIWSRCPTKNMWRGQQCVCTICEGMNTGFVSR